MPLLIMRIDCMNTGAVQLKGVMLLHWIWLCVRVPKADELKHAELIEPECGHLKEQCR